MTYSKERKPVNGLERENMPKLEEHISRSLQRTGKSFAEIHEYLDGNSLSVFEKIKRHSIISASRNFENIKRKFGKEGAEEYMQHLKEDYQKFPLRFLWLLFEKRIKKR